MIKTVKLSDGDILVLQPKTNLSLEHIQSMRRLWHEAIKGNGHESDIAVIILPGDVDLTVVRMEREKMTIRPKRTRMLRVEINEQTNKV